MRAIDLYRSHTQPLAIWNLERPRTLHAIFVVSRGIAANTGSLANHGKAISDARRRPGAIDDETYAHVILGQ